MKLTLTGATDTGKAREHNEDSYAIFSDNSAEPKTEYLLNEQGVLLVVADGIGGANAGEVASALAISSVKEYLGKLPDDWSGSPDLIPNALVGAIKYAHRKVLKRGRHHPESSGMGTTIVLAYLNDGNMHVVWAGDSRCYVHRKDELELITHDHSFVQELVDDGQISYEESLCHPERNYITKCVGGSSPGIVDPEVRLFKLEAGDRILLCSDGLNGMLVDQRLGEIIATHADLNDCAEALIQEANAMGGSDNITVVMAEVLC